MDKSLNSCWSQSIRSTSYRLGSYLFDDPTDPSLVRLIDGPINALSVVEGAINHSYAQGVENDDSLRSILDLNPIFLWGMLYAASIRRCRVLNDRLRDLDPGSSDHRHAFDQLNIAIANLEYIEEAASSFIRPAADSKDSRISKSA